MLKLRTVLSSLLVLSLVLMVGACAPLQRNLSEVIRGVATSPPPSGPITTPIAKTPVIAKSVAAAQIALTELERLALRYTTLPECGPAAAPRLCHDPVLKARIKEYDTYAFNAVMSARRGVGSLETAVAAITAFRDLIPNM